VTDGLTRYDYAIVGAGIAGASLAAQIAPHASVLILEAEDAPGYHATGRSAAFWSESYGGPDVQPLTSASGPWLQAGGYLAPLGSLHIGRSTDDGTAAAMLADFAQSGVQLARVEPASFVSGLRRDWTIGLFEPSCAYIDVARLHGDYLGSARQDGASVVTDAQLEAAHLSDETWRIETRAGVFAAGVLVDAAGAWADEVAARAGIAPIGIAPFRRTMAQLRVDPPVPDGMPIVSDLSGNFYFKPEAGGRIWLSPHDEIACEPGDAAPEEIDVAIAIDRLEQVVDWRVTAVERRWAGLRSFAPDRLPVYGFDTDNPRFFWCAGQGGFGIQTAPAAAVLAAGLLRDRRPAPSVAHIDARLYAPSRFGRKHGK
jgi:D-arginine dehydrogenase